MTEWRGAIARGRNGVLLRAFALSMASFAHAWLLVPALLVVLCLGSGLLVARAAGPSLPRVLVLPAGLATVIVVAVLFTYFDATSELAAPAIAVVALAGLALTGRRLRTLVPPGRRALWPAVAALAPAVTIAAPVVLTGDPGFTGYARIVDIAHQFDFAAWLQENGRAMPVVVDDSYEENVSKMLGVGYPGGAQAAHGSIAALAGIDLAWAYQPFLAVVGGMLGLALYGLLARLIPSRPLRAVAAGVAAQPTILFSYTLAAGIKELAAAAMLALLAAALAAHRPSAGPRRALLPATIATAAAFAVFNLAILPWLGLLLVGLFAADLAQAGRERGRAVVRWAALGIGAGVLAFPSVLGAIKLAPVATAGGPADLGNLAVPVPAWAAGGVWLTGDFRFSLSEVGTGTLTRVLVVGVLALALAGLVRAVRHRERGVAALAAAGAGAVAFITWKSGPWVELKAYSVTAPVTLALAFSGVAAIAASRRMRRVAPLIAGVVAVAVLAGNALAYRSTTLAPHDRLAELQRIGERFGGQGPALYPFFEEYAEYFLRDLETVGLVNPPASGIPRLTDDARGGTVFARDVDEFEPDYLQSYRLLVLRRDPVNSRPPSNFRLVGRTDYYEVWKRDSSPSTVVSHVALAGDPAERTPAFCRALVRDLRAAGPGARLAYAPARDVVQVSGDRSIKPPRWDFVAPDFFAAGPGRLVLNVSIPYPDTWAVWLRGSFGREVRVSVDGVALDPVRWQQSYPLQYEPLGKLELPAGEHRIEIVRGGGTLLPGTGNDIGTQDPTTTIGPIAFLPTGQQTAVQIVPASEAMEICRSERRYDWVEIVRPGARETT